MKVRGREGKREGKGTGLREGKGTGLFFCVSRIKVDIIQGTFGAEACGLLLGSPLINLPSVPNCENQNDYFLILDLT